MSSFGCRWRSEERMWCMVYFVPLSHENWPRPGNTATLFFLYGQIFGPIGDLPCLPEAFHARFPVSVKMCRPRACGRRSSSWHTRKNLWYPGYWWPYIVLGVLFPARASVPTGMKQGLSCEHLQMKFMTLHSFHAFLSWGQLGHAWKRDTLIDLQISWAEVLILKQRLLRIY